MIKWTATKSEQRTIQSIAERAVAMAEKHGVPYTIQDATMDIYACHSSGCRLQLDTLLSADDGNFAHDVFGIRRHIDRKTGRLQNCFLPRYAEHEPAEHIA